MKNIKKLWFAALTKTQAEVDEDNLIHKPGTPDNIKLEISENGLLKVRQILEGGQGEGRTNFYSIDLDGGQLKREFDKLKLDDTSIKLLAIGNDAWMPKILFLWGEGEKPIWSTSSHSVEPIAIETMIGNGISKDDNDENASDELSMKIVKGGGEETIINRLILIVTTKGTLNSSDGTVDPVELEIKNDAGVFVKHILPQTGQDDLQGGQTNIYIIPLRLENPAGPLFSNGFTKKSLNKYSITLRIRGGNRWAPRRLFLFGKNVDFLGQTISMVPLVHIPEWNLGALSMDSNEGEESVTLPILSPGINFLKEQSKTHKL